jgi:hypothetical protein
MAKTGLMIHWHSRPARLASANAVFPFWLRNDHPDKARASGDHAEAERRVWPCWRVCRWSRDTRRSGWRSTPLTCDIVSLPRGDANRQSGLARPLGVGFSLCALRFALGARRQEWPAHWPIAPEANQSASLTSRPRVAAGFGSGNRRRRRRFSCCGSIQVGQAEEVTRQIRRNAVSSGRRMGLLPAGRRLPCLRS